MTEKSEPTAEGVSITVLPSAAHPDVLSVQDAMRQVLDFFDLLLPEDQSVDFVWNLSVARTNTPFTVIGEPASLKRDIDVSMIARAQRHQLAEQLRALTSGNRPARKISRKRRETVRRIFSRNMNGIGRTDAMLDRPDNLVRITPLMAQAGIAALAKEEGEFDQFLSGHREREEVGSIEGVLIEVGTEYNQPSILVRERKSAQEIWCRVDPELMETISTQANFRDVWERRRVIVAGLIRFSGNGEVLRVYAQSVTPIFPRQMTIHDIKDANFTGGLSAKEYLEKLREGELGE